MMIALWTISLLIGIPVVALALLIVVANTDSGRRQIEALVPKLTAGEVRITALRGEFPGHLQVGHAEVRDKDGNWLALDDLILDWSPLLLVTGKAKIAQLSAGHVGLSRLPTASSSKSTSGAGLPLRVAIDAFHVTRLDLAPPIVTAAASVEVDGRLTLNSLQDGDGTVTIRRLDAPGNYELEGKVDSKSVKARISGSEPAQGLLSALGNLPELGPLSLSLTLDGPRNAERAALSLNAGALQARGQGTVDLVGNKADLDLTAEAPAMKPGPDLAWQSARLAAHFHGPFSTPNADASLEINALTAGNAGFDRISAKIIGQGGKLNTKAEIVGFRIGGQPSPFTTEPLKLDADAILDQPARPITFKLSHPLIVIEGRADLGGDINGSISMIVTDLAPFATTQGLSLQGHASATASAIRKGSTTRVTADGQIAVTGGQPMAVKAGGDVTFGFAADLNGQDVTIEHAAVDGKAIHAALRGSRKNGSFNADLSLSLPDLSAVQPPYSGALTLRANIKGPETGFIGTALIDGEIAAPGIPRSPLKVSLEAQGLPTLPAAKIDAQGSLAGAPLVVAAQFERDASGTTRFAIEKASWKSFQANGDLSLAPGSALPTGRLDLSMKRLNELEPFLGSPLQGDLRASLDTITAKNGTPQSIVKLNANGVAFGNNRIDRLSLDGHVDDPIAHPIVALKIDATGIAANGVAGSAKIDATGPQDALSVRLTSDLESSGLPARIAINATADLPHQAVRLTTLDASYANEKLRLLQPLRVTYGNEIAIDRLRLALGDAVITGAGKLSPSLAFTLSVRNASPSLAAPFLPSDLAAEGTIGFDAKLTGAATSPNGDIRLSAHDLQLRSDMGRGLPRANLDASAILSGGSARVAARLGMGSKAALKLDGSVPLAASGPLDLRTSGFVDLVVLNPLLAPAGRSAEGKLSLNAAIAGNAAAPRITGNATLAGGSVQDFAQGIHLTDIHGRIDAEGDTLRFDTLAGRAGPGSWTINGTISPTAPGLPIDLKLSAKNARPLASDFITADLNADLTVTGQAAQQVALAGDIKINHAEINIPDSLPKSVATLDVVYPGETPQRPPSPPLEIDLDLKVRAPEQIFVRGHGLDAEMGGKLTITGATAKPQIAGGFDLRHGTFSIAGKTLDFTSGRIGFNGTSPNGKLDPTLAFVATTSAGDVTATLNVTGYADAPKISLSSSPTLPQDEILARLLFGQSTKQLSPLQMAEILEAIASLSGVTPGGLSNPLAAVRKGLGLDRLSVGSATNNTSGASIEAGKYVANGVYVGTKQNTSGGTVAQVQIDLTKHLKAVSQLGTGGGTPATGLTPDNDPGSSLGLTYQFEY
ncbi:MAG TPA: translocation/assembly module TamB domain-containing protein [Alphaproteobacteria bacterium]|nr:translocation/assembly module TamB domain-containing protein [Alphaproteobacteria bacterium]